MSLWYAAYAQLARGFSAMGINVDVFTRRAHPSLPAVFVGLRRERARCMCLWTTPVRPKKKLLPHMDELHDFFPGWCKAQKKNPPIEYMDLGWIDVWQELRRDDGRIHFRSGQSRDRSKRRSQYYQ